MITTDRRQSKTVVLSTNVDKKSLETEFLIALLCSDWQQMAIKNTILNEF